MAAVAAVALFAVGALAASFSLDAEDVSSGAAGVAACGTNATVQWRINASDAVQPTTTLANFLVEEAVVKAGTSCANRPFRLAVQVGNVERLCAGTFNTNGEATVALSGCGGAANVQLITGAALLIGDSNTAFPLTIINP